MHKMDKSYAYPFFNQGSISGQPTVRPLDSKVGIYPRGLSRRLRPSIPSEPSTFFSSFKVLQINNDKVNFQH